MLDILAFYDIIIKLIPDAVIAQPVERILGKDEVPGSNPGNSSIKNYRYRCVWRKARRINRFRAFSSPDFFF